MQTTQQLEDALFRQRSLAAAAAAAHLRFANIIDSSDDAIIGQLLNGNITSWNPGANRMFGYSAKEMIGQPMSRLFPPESMREEPEILKRIGRGERIEHFETVRLHKNGGRVDVSETISPDVDGELRIIGAHNVSRDITERKRLADKLDASEGRYRRLFESAKDGIFILDAETGQIVDANPFLMEMLGYSHAEFLGKKLWEVGSFKDIADSKTAFQKLQEKEYIRYEDLPLETKDGRRISVEFVSNVYLVDGQKVIQCNIRDITKRKQAEEALRASEEKFRQLAEAELHLVWMCRPDGWNIYFNQRWVDYTGLTLEESYGHGWNKPFHPEDQPHAWNAWQQATQHGAPYDLECRLRRRDGQYRWFVIRGQPLRDADGKIFKWFGTCTDIHDGKQSEESMRLLGSAVEQAKESILITDAQLDLPGPKIIFVNPAFTRMTGYSAEEVIGKTPRILQGPKTDKAVLNRLRENLSRGEVFEGEAINYRKDGIEYVQEWQITPIRDPKGTITHYVAIQRDITQHRKLEEQLRQSQKMDAIGQLAGGVAHDFNNILAVIQMQAGLLKLGEDVPPSQLELADEIGASVQRAADLTRQLLLFSRKEVMHLQDLDLNESIQSIGKMLARTIGEEIEMQLKLAAQPLIIHGDAGMIDQVLMNLTVNARDAMPNGGDLLIETDAVEFDELAAAQHAPARPGSFVRLSVSDAGTGIRAEILPKIFEPFFTTKEVGKGTGLGLATVFGIVQQHQGWVNVYSEVGHGTTFRIYLPRLEKMSGKKAFNTQFKNLTGGKETILLVEDDKSLNALTCKALTRFGYRVLTAFDGPEALKVWQEQRAEIQLVLTDLVMPGGMNGKELGKQLLRENPKLKIIYASGYSAEVAGKDFSLTEGVNFLAKPFQAAKLARTVRALLDA